MSDARTKTDAAYGMAETRAFWDANPCGVHGAYDLQREQRYAMEPWIPAKLSQIAKRHSNILEVGCGQGVDAMTLCGQLPPNGRYEGIDYSQASISTSELNARNLTAQLSVTPHFQVGDAENLPFPDSAFEAVYSMGVLHHTADERRAVKEVHRVLAPAGIAYIALYRTFSPKVAVALVLRKIQAVFDRLAGTDRAIYSFLAGHGTSHPLFGTMFHECFGVPYLKSYTEAQMRDLFSDFDIRLIQPIGANLGRLAPRRDGRSSIGVFWWIEACKRP